jgi:hypothetical protein
MGAKDDDEKKKAEAEEPLSGKELKSLIAAGADIGRAIAHLDDSGISSRELEIVVVKLEEAEMWLDRGFEEFGYEPDDGPDDDEPDEADEDEDDDEADTGT